MKRSTYNWLEERGDHWLTVSTMHSNVIKSAKFPAGSDLKRTLIHAIAEWANDGWDVESFNSASSGFFCNKGGDRRHVSIVPSDPGRVAPVYRPR